MRHRVSQNCTEVTPQCLVENTIYGYAPNLGLNAFFVAIFSICALAQIYLGTKYKTFFFAYVITLGAIGEAIGYGGRIIMHSNPYSSLGFKIQISCLIFSPAFIAAGIYLTLKHIVLAFGQERSKIQARYYTWIFITCDWISLMLQAVGGGFAGGAGNNVKLRNTGTNLMISGIVWQVATLITFSALVVDYALRTRRAWSDVTPEAKGLLSQSKFRSFLAAAAVAFTTVFLRCVYRIAEMVGGWANPIMRDEIGFDIMEGVMIVIAVLALTIFHPGFYFPQLAGRKWEKPSVELDSLDESDVALRERNIREEPKSVQVSTIGE
ncbi:RTA1-domain-containing protein [Hyaloscypha variabilis F]|uniref:RTA1-domain-containing protein n=1 Tax=Hyaloscypha variabilis (strain UAMH 11265 / GT02V1 / F) TaxID=1149755 RepID=A0A2J6RY99_HYAVF|nr:RTA1-domain-containing protein [Hyaloscypha variabilis F]